MKLVFLGTGAMLPTKDRNVQSIYLEYEGKGILLDCGEGTQRQMRMCGVNAQKINIILISHWHGDHVSGLVGLLQTIGNFSHEKNVKIFGPPGSKKYYDHMMNSCIFEDKLKVDLEEIDAKELTTLYRTEDFEIQGINLNHSVPCLGFAFVRKERRKMDSIKLRQLGLKGAAVGQLQQGNPVRVENKEIPPDNVSTIVPSKKIAFIFDTGECDGCYELAENAQLLVSEAVFSSRHEERAQETQHLTAKLAAKIASTCGVNKLVLTHFSQRYKSVRELEQDAKDLFENVILAYDLMKIDPLM